MKDLAKTGPMWTERNIDCKAFQRSVMNFRDN